VPLVKRIMRGISVEVAEAAAHAALAMGTAAESEAELRRHLARVIGGEGFLGEAAM
jgi:hypothetical protein